MEQNRDYRFGIIAATGCSVLWGVLPLYWQMLRPIESSTIIFYRIFLVGLITGILSLKLYGIDEIKRNLKPKGNVLKFLIAGLLITCNWSLYIWAVNADHVIQTCVGYYIEPLMVSVFGLIFFKEKLTIYKSISLSLAAAGIVVILFHFMEIPFIALGLALTFATYAAVKKAFNLPSILALFYESMIIMWPALGVVIWMECTGNGALAVATPGRYALLLCCGLFTVIPLGLFGSAATKIPLVTLGQLEYLSPSISLIIGIFVMHEPFDLIQFLAFVIIWIGLVFFTIGEVKASRNKQQLITVPEIDLFRNIFPAEHDRFSFPADIHRVTACKGGESFLILGSEKNALYDCGMALGGPDLVHNIKCFTDHLDYVILSHSHYDHMGGLPYVLDAFADACVCASAKCAKIFTSENAKKTMTRLGEEARRQYAPHSKVKVRTDGIRVDRILSEGDQISLGNLTLTAYETKGHTDCSMSFYVEEIGLLFTSESTGIIKKTDWVDTPILKDFDDAMVSLKKCKGLHPEYVCLPHYAMLPSYYNEKYFYLFEQECQYKLDYVKKLLDAGLDKEEIIKQYRKDFWFDEIAEEAPYEAFATNSVHIVDALMRAVLKRR